MVVLSCAPIAMEFHQIRFSNCQVILTTIGIDAYQRLCDRLILDNGIVPSWQRRALDDDLSAGPDSD